MRTVLQLINDYGILPKKALGQNFLFDPNLLKKISSVVDISNKNLVEIGSGPGGLSRHLILQNPSKFLALELDLQFIPLLEETINCYKSEKYRIISGDVLEFNWDFFKGEEYYLFGNLPYNISSQILFRVIENIELIPNIVIMLQKELASRIKSPTSCKNYGRLSVLVQSFFDLNTSFDVKKHMFYPVPNVDSTLLHLARKDIIPHKELYKSLNILLRHAFGNRRKLLIRNLQNLIPDIERILDSLSINKKSRAEEVSVSKYLEIAKFVKPGFFRS